MGQELVVGMLRAIAPPPHHSTSHLWNDIFPWSPLYSLRNLCRLCAWLTPPSRLGTFGNHSAGSHPHSHPPATPAASPHQPRRQGCPVHSLLVPSLIVSLNSGSLPSSSHPVHMNTILYLETWGSTPCSVLPYHPPRPLSLTSEMAIPAEQWHFSGPVSYFEWPSAPLIPSQWFWGVRVVSNSSHLGNINVCHIRQK